MIQERIKKLLEAINRGIYEKETELSLLLDCGFAFLLSRSRNHPKLH